MSQASTPPITGKPLRVVAAGLCCAVGYTAEAAACALRAGMDHFQESEFVTGNGEPIRVARMPDTETWGSQRQSQWMVHAVNDCLSQIAQSATHPAFNPTSNAATPLTVFLLCAEPDRPGVEERNAIEAALMGSNLLKQPLSSHSRVWHSGRAGLSAVLQGAYDLLAKGTCHQVMLLGFDSYLNAQTINHYLQAERLLVPGNRDGFIPGEAAAAVLLELARPETTGLHITGWGEAMEAGRPDGSVPSRAQGLSQAMRAAFNQADITCNDLAFRVSDQNGEGFFAGEAANAITRVAEEGGTVPMVYTTADCVGEVGAATGPLMLAWLNQLLHRQDSFGDCGVIHLANDQGLRSAVVVQHFESSVDLVSSPVQAVTAGPVNPAAQRL